MENTPEAAGAAQAPQTEATPIINSTPAPAQIQTSAPVAPDMHGFTSDQLADMKKFFDSQGGYEKVKSRISNPQNYSESAQKPNLDATQALQNQQEQMKAPTQPAYHAPLGSITRDEFVAQEYAQALSRDPAFASISEEIANGAFLKDMAKLNIRLVNQDGSLNDGQVREYLRLKAATVAAKQTQVTPEASAAPTVDYAPYDENNMDMQKAMAILQQDSALREQGQAGHPHSQDAEAFMKKLLNPQE